MLLLTATLTRWHCAERAPAIEDIEYASFTRPYPQLQDEMQESDTSSHVNDIIADSDGCADTQLSLVRSTSWSSWVEIGWDTDSSDSSVVSLTLPLQVSMAHPVMFLVTCSASPVLQAMLVRRRMEREANPTERTLQSVVHQLLTAASSNSPSDADVICL